MKIISKFHDYYDIGLGLSHDVSIKYVREPREIEIASINRLSSKEDLETYKLYKKLPNFHSSRWFTGVIGFCGKFYPFVQPMFRSEKILLYSLKEIDNYQKDTLKAAQLNIWKGGYSERRFFERMFESYRAFNDLEAFIVNRSPIVVFTTRDKSKAVWDDRLRDYCFEKIIHPYEAFQEIEMFLSNLAAPEKPAPPQSDAQKVQSHGFDKMSFRKGKRS